MAEGVTLETSSEFVRYFYPHFAFDPLTSQTAQGHLPVTGGEWVRAIPWHARHHLANRLLSLGNKFMYI